MTAKLLKRIPLIALFLSLVIPTCYADSSNSRIYEKTSNYDYEDTLLNLDIAISEHNYRIIHRSKIGQAVRDRGEENYPLSIVISFCNITYAKEMMEINPSLINDMPCIVTVREQEQKVIVGTKLMDTTTHNPSQKAFAQRINENLLSIIEATIE